jgi:hypothetical protein
VWPDGRKFTMTAGFTVPVTMPMTLANQDDIKDFLLTSQPTNEARRIYSKLEWRDE